MLFIEQIGDLFMACLAMLLQLEPITIFIFVILSVSAGAYVVTRLFRKKI